MDISSPSRVAGVVIRKVVLGGVEYTLSQPDKVRRAADEEAIVCSRRRLPAGLTPAERAAAINVLVCGIASPEEWHAYFHSLWQLSFRFWNALDPSEKLSKGGTKGETPAEMLRGVLWAFEVINSDGVTQDELDGLWRAILVVGQEDAIKNSSGSPEAAGTPTTDTPIIAATP